ncbi:MAG: FkbM family methyltransferase [Ignavibacteria bacterium]|nr:FkbM family methyltransferase [Ignavibacteria bacterium]
MGILERTNNKIKKEFFKFSNKELTENLERLVSELNYIAPVNFCSVGARGGNPYLINYLRRLRIANTIGFEPDSEEARILRTNNIYEEVFEYALGEYETDETLYITKEPGCSSILKPNMDFIKKHFSSPDWFEIVNEALIHVTGLDNISSKLPDIDIIQIDTQGYEYQIIKGGEETIKRIPVIIFESHMYELYEGQKTFFQIHNLMTKNNFLLNDLKQQGDFGCLGAEFNFVYFNENLFKSEKNKVTTLLKTAYHLNNNSFDELLIKII